MYVRFNAIYKKNLFLVRQNTELFFNECICYAHNIKLFYVLVMKYKTVTKLKKKILIRVKKYKLVNTILNRMIRPSENNNIICVK